MIENTVVRCDCSPAIIQEVLPGDDYVIDGEVDDLLAIMPKGEKVTIRQCKSKLFQIFSRHCKSDPFYVHVYMSYS